MKLVIQIPCYNEEKTLPLVFSSLPRKLNGIDEIKILVIDDGSADETSKVAKSLGADYVVRHPVNKGLARTFSTGILTSLQMGADIIVNIDGDNQYCADDINKLIEPIIRKEADFVIGVRPIKDIKEFSFIKKKLQVLGSFVVSKISGIDIPDVTSGFRAITRDAAMKLNLFSLYTYTL
jgi:glycosyltransferase involved in cell wall biosynthesis